MTLISAIPSLADIDELRIREGVYEKNFSTFLITPYLKDSELSFNAAKVCEKAPGRAVCMSIPHYIQLKNGYEAGKIYKSNMGEDTGFGWETIIFTSILGIATGIVVDHALIRR